MKTRLSALMDGELDRHEMLETLRTLHAAASLHAEIAAYQLIGDALRDETELDLELSARVMAAIEQEPVVVRLALRRESGWQRPALALAASAAGVTLVAWLALAPTADHQLPALAAGPASSDQLRPREVALASDPVSRQRMQEYLVAHQVYAPVGAMNGGANHVRTVSMAREGR
ncbi:MAG: hypothetical protein CVU17_09345 [Betaproteobacteria bacterium HGW-Betaproteobacteria-11]|nr:MAG: hypothetical protein CVU17_09345 [Betaproteobacteria bacterium HGW-Betaproteobacteria-11]